VKGDGRCHGGLLRVGIGVDEVQYEGLGQNPALVLPGIVFGVCATVFVLVSIIPMLTVPLGNYGVN
jgi:hypothetical protein